MPLSGHIVHFLFALELVIHGIHSSRRTSCINKTNCNEGGHGDTASKIYTVKIGHDFIALAFAFLMRLGPAAGALDHPAAVVAQSGHIDKYTADLLIQISHCKSGTAALTAADGSKVLAVKLLQSRHIVHDFAQRQPDIPEKVGVAVADIADGVELFRQFFSKFCQKFFLFGTVFAGSKFVNIQPGFDRRGTSTVGRSSRQRTGTGAGYTDLGGVLFAAILRTG